MTDKQIVESAIYRGFERAWLDAALDAPRGEDVVAAVMEELEHPEVRISLLEWLVSEERKKAEEREKLNADSHREDRR